VLDNFSPQLTNEEGHPRAGDDSYRLCHVQGPGGIIVALAEQLS
jgi:hypothetical protein